MSAALAPVYALLGYSFHNPVLLMTALTHPSHADVSSGRSASYDRLEFLGDRVLGLAVATMLYAAFPDDSEGDLARRHTRLVRGETCAAVARALGLGAYIRFGSSEAQGGGRDKTAILENVCEAVIGALYLDGGFAVAETFVQQNWKDLLASSNGSDRDPKTALQEWAQARGLKTPAYTLVERTGPDHAPHFVISVAVDGQSPAIGQGASKRAAEQMAARMLLERLVS